MIDFTATAYHPQCNGQAEQYNCTLVTRLSHYINEHQDDWEQFLQPLTYAYDMKVHRSTGFTQFQPVLILVPAGPAVSRLRSHEELLTATALSNFSHKAADLKAARGPTRERVRATVSDATSSLRKVQDRCKTDHDHWLPFCNDVRPVDSE